MTMAISACRTILVTGIGSATTEHGMPPQHHDVADLFRKLFCAVFCACDEKRARVTLRSGKTSITFLVTNGDTFMSTVLDDGGPFTADISGFIDSKGNP